jgi:hypothetical protein
VKQISKNYVWEVVGNSNVDRRRRRSRGSKYYREGTSAANSPNSEHKRNNKVNQNV